MTLIKKRDVKDCFAAKGNQGSGIHIVPTSQPDATVVVVTTPADFNQDFTADHSSSHKSHPSAGDSNAPTDPQASSVFGRVRK